MNDEIEKIISKISNERFELDDKLYFLNAFICTDKFDALSKESSKLLLEQQAVMTRYSNILEDRINLLNKEKGK